LKDLGILTILSGLVTWLIKSLGESYFKRKFAAYEKELDNYQGLPKTIQAVTQLSSLMNTFEGGSCAMYAFEKEIPKISQVKLEGLAEFYGISSDQATEYFRLHTEADIRHAASWRKALDDYSSKEEDLIEIAEKSISAQNLLLDSCYESYC